MTTFDTSPSATRGTRFGGRLGALVSRFQAWNDVRTTRNALSRLSDHALDDLGLTRGDVDRMSRF